MSDLSEFEQRLSRAFDVGYVMVLDHLTTCGDTVSVEECPLRADHEREGESGADRIAEMRAEEGRS